eukprot:jgi/Ulvmu1/6710/UM030_0043.1
MAASRGAGSGVCSVCGAANAMVLVRQAAVTLPCYQTYRDCVKGMRQIEPEQAYLRWADPGDLADTFACGGAVWRPERVCDPTRQRQSRHPYDTRSTQHGSSASDSASQEPEQLYEACRCEQELRACAHGPWTAFDWPRAIKAS